MVAGCTLRCSVQQLFCRAGACLVLGRVVEWKFRNRQRGRGGRVQGRHESDARDGCFLGGQASARKSVSSKAVPAGRVETNLIQHF